MKLIGTILLSVFMFFGQQENPWEYKTYAEVTNKHGVLFTLEYGMKKRYNGQVRWRITNHTQKTFYDIGIADKEYTLKDGKTVKVSGESFVNVLAPNESKTSMPDSVNSSENYGNWSDKNKNPVITAVLKTPMIQMAVTKNGERYDWGMAGSVILK